MTKTGRLPACSRPWVGFRSASQTSPRRGTDGASLLARTAMFSIGGCWSAYYVAVIGPDLTHIQTIEQRAIEYLALLQLGLPGGRITTKRGIVSIYPLQESLPIFVLRQRHSRTNKDALITSLGDDQRSFLYAESTA